MMGVFSRMNESRMIQEQELANMVTTGRIGKLVFTETFLDLFKSLLGVDKEGSEDCTDVCTVGLRE